MIELIPAIDIIDGKCVRLSQGDYQSKKVYNENPVEVAKIFEAHGIHRLHVVDLDGAASKHVVNYKVLEALAGQTSLVIDFGGGIKSDEDLHIAFESGAQMVTLGSIAVKEPDTFNRWMEVYGSERIILGADAKDGKIAVNGWLECSRLELMPFLDVPIYVLAGDADPVGNFGRGPRRVCNNLIKSGKTKVFLQIYHGGRHEMHNETERDEVLRGIAAFLRGNLN